MSHPHDERARGRWQGIVFGLSLVVAFFVYAYWPEPEESVRGYTPAGCHEQAKDLFARARVTRDVRSRSEFLASAVKYIEALEERFGIRSSRWDAYEMLGDACVELAAAAESDREVARQLRLKGPPEARAEALRAYRAAGGLLDADSPERPRLLRKAAEMLLALDRPAEAVEILRGLVKLYRSDKVDRLRRERGEEVARRGGPDVAPQDVPGREDEARHAYFLAGGAAFAAARELESNPAFAADAEARAEADAFRREAGRAFTDFLDSGGSGERRAAAETALGDLAFARAAASPPEKAREFLDAAAGHFGAAGTPAAEFLRARALYGMGDHGKALRIFRRSRIDMTAAERRARRYMEGRCLLALDLVEGARGVFAAIRSDDKDDADGVAALVGLADIALGSGDLTRAAELLREAAAHRGGARKGMPLAERDRELEGPRLAAKHVSLAEAFERKGDLDQAVAVSREALELDPARREALLRRIASALEQKADAEADKDGQDGQDGQDLSCPSLLRAAETYLDLAGAVASPRTRREALEHAADLFAAGGARARAIQVARGFLRAWPEDAAASRVLHSLATWEGELGLTDEAVAHLAGNVDRHWSDVYADRSLVALARLLVRRSRPGDLEEAGRRLREVVSGKGRAGERYGAGTLVRLEALFLLGEADLRLAAGARGAGEKARLLEEAVAALGEARAETPEKYPASGEGSRPRFRELVDRERPGALLARGEALYGLASLADDESRARALLAEAAGAFREAAGAGAGGPARIGLALVECRLASDPATRRESARVALAELGADGSGDRILSPAEWRRWSDWIGERGREGSADGGAN